MQGASACEHASTYPSFLGFQPVSSIEMRFCLKHSRVAEWDLDTTKLALELQYVSHQGGMPEQKKKTFKLCNPGGIEVFKASPTFTYRSFILCAQKEGK